MRSLLACFLSVSIAFSAAGCTVNPATGRTQLDFGMGQEQEIALGTEASPQFLTENGGEIPSPQILAYVREIGAKLASSSERPDLPWEFHVLDSKQINAFALPGGKVFFSRGLLEKMSNEAQVAAVMGHEVGHVTGKHINERISQSTLLTGLITAVGVAGEASNKQWLQVLGVGGQLGGAVYLLKFGRDQESEADRLGIRYMAENGWNPIGMMQVMEILKAASGGGAGWEILATHPNPERRAVEAEKLILEKYPDYNDTGRYVLNEARFQQVVVANLRRLPPAKHGSEAALARPPLRDAMAAAIPDASRRSALDKAMERMHQLRSCACHPPAPLPQQVIEAQDQR